jgi:hypothetical protein
VESLVHTEQHCEVDGYTDEVWAACDVGNCLTLLCYEHFDGSLATVHEQSCTGRDRLEQLEDVSVPSSLLESVQTAIQDKVIDPLQQVENSSGNLVNCRENQLHDYDSTVTASPSPQSPLSKSVLYSDLNNNLNSNAVNVLEWESPNPNVNLIPKQIIVNKKGIKRVLSFQARWFNEFPWIHFCSEIHGVLCFYCAKAEAKQLSNLAKKGKQHSLLMGTVTGKRALKNLQITRIVKVINFKSSN